MKDSAIKHIIISATTLGVICLVALTWALTRICAWIVFHDPVWDKMDREGALTEHMIAEVVLVARDFYVPAIEAVLGCAFLVLLWRFLFLKGAAERTEANGK